MHKNIKLVIPALSLGLLVNAQLTDVYFDKNHKLNDIGELYHNEAFRGAQYSINDLINFGHLEPYQYEIADFYNTLISLIFKDEGANNKYQEFYNKYPQSVMLERGHLELGNYYLYNQNYPKASEELALVDSYILPDFEKSKLLIKLGYAQFITGDNTSAEISLRKAEEHSGKYGSEISYLLKQLKSGTPENIKPIDSILPLKTKYFENYIKASYGTRNFWSTDAFLIHPIKNDRIGIKFSGLGTDGPHNKYDWKTSSSDVSTEGFYIMNLKSGKLHLAGNYTYSNSNYYGLDIPELLSSPNMNLRQETNKLTFKSDYDLYSNNYLDNISLQTGRWWNKFNAQESFVDMKAKLAKSSENASLMLPGLNFGVEADAIFNYTFTKFDLNRENEFSYLTTGFAPVLKISSLGSYLKIGGNLMYNGRLDNNVSKFFFYPKAEFLFHAAKEISIYTGIDGGLKLHNISEMSEENPYLYPDQRISPTNTLYDIYGGIKGDVGKSVKYIVSVSYKKAENLLFYGRTPYMGVPSVLKPYNRMNALQAVYDDGNILSVKAALQYFWNGNLSFGVEGEYNNYDLENLSDAYNLPDFRFSAEGAYKTLENKLSLGAKLYFTGDRKSNYYSLVAGDVLEGVKTLNNYFDLNLSASYQLSDNFSIFIYGNNLFNKNYERLEGYKVTGIQGVGGLIFKF